MGLYATTEEMEQVVLAFERYTLPERDWTHAAHLTVALWYLIRYPAADATRRIRTGIQAYNASRGLASTPAGGYHETITLFYIRIVLKYLRGADTCRPLPELFDGLMREYGHKKFLSQHYSRPLLLSEEARTAWVAPDLHPFEG